jgi:isoquinoline 1-oxidoreductase alpha subunit
MNITLKINGADHELSVDPQMPLLWVLRDVLKMTGTKYGCGRALCGACTVHLDSQPIRACVTPATAVQGKAITTIEGLGGDHRLQEAWVRHNVPQCGYCQSGQLMSAAARLAANPDPSDEAIVEAMNGNICRCGTYQRIRAAVHRAAELRASA